MVLWFYDGTNRCPRSCCQKKKQGGRMFSADPENSFLRRIECLTVSTSLGRRRCRQCYVGSRELVSAITTPKSPSAATMAMVAKLLLLLLFSSISHHHLIFYRLSMMDMPSPP
jgi:hypothetical protein